MRFAQVLIEARGERPAEHGVEHFEDEIVRRRSCRPDGADANLRLRGPRFVHEIHLSSGRAGRADGTTAGGGFAPAAVQFPNAVSSRGATDWRVTSPATMRARVVASEVCRVVAAQVVNGEGFQGGGGATHRRAVAMCVAEEQRRKCRGRDRAWIVTRLKQRGEALVAQTRELVGRERRRPEDVGHDRERRRKPRSRDLQPERGTIETARRREARTEEIDGVGNLERVSAGGAFVQHRGREAGQPESAGRIRRSAGENEQADTCHRHVVAFDEIDLQAAGELEALNRRQSQRGRRGDLRRHRAVGRLRGNVRDQRGREDGQASLRPHGFAPSGSTVSSMRASDKRYR